ncbi:MAG: GTPase HflX, partial [Candidatus Omnitrophica bacterium]|nr:GTPase HflX [Candidatus Omnitrophota bacterium]
MEKVLLVTVDLESDKERWPVDEVAMELEELTSACGVEIIDNVMCPREKPTPDLYIGKGKAEEIAFLSQEQEIDTVIFSHDLSGTQQRNLEEVIGKKT